MNKISPLSRLVNKPAKSPGLSRTGPELIFMPTSISLAIILDNVVLPKPGGPCNKTWSSASPRIFAALTKTFRFSTTLGCPLKSSNCLGRNALSNSKSILDSESRSGFKFSFI